MRVTLKSPRGAFPRRVAPQPRVAGSRPAAKLLLTSKGRAFGRRRSRSRRSWVESKRPWGRSRKVLKFGDGPGSCLGAMTWPRPPVPTGGNSLPVTKAIVPGCDQFKTAPVADFGGSLKTLAARPTGLCAGFWYPCRAPRQPIRDGSVPKLRNEQAPALLNQQRKYS